MWCAIFPRVCAKAHILQGRFGTSSDRTCADPPVEDGSASIFCCRSSGRRGSFLRIWRVRSSIRRAGTNGLLSERLSLARRFVSRSLLSNVPTHPQDCRFFRGLPLKMSTKSEIRFLPLPRVYDGLFRVSSGRGRNGCVPAIRPFVQDFPLCGKHAGRPIISCTAAGNKRKFGTR